jgi:uncharacterized protein
MPTNILRSRTKPRSVKAARVRDAVRRVVITVGRVRLRADLLDTPTADRVWDALPIFSSAEPWGQSVKFETPVETGREPEARAIAEPGEIAFWAEDDRVVIAYGPTPIAKRGELRLPRPCNIWAKAVDDVTLLKSVTPGEKVSVVAA